MAGLQLEPTLVEEKHSSDQKGEKQISKTTATGRIVKPSTQTISSSSSPMSSSSSSSSSLFSLFFSILGGVLVGLAVGVFSTYFPIFLDITPGRAASTAVYQNAYYHYSQQLSLFDNTILTYGTDYGLGLAMLLSAYYIISSAAAPRSSRSNNSAAALIKTQPLHVQQALQQSQELLDRHVWRSRGLLLTYMLSVLAGGFAHQFYTTVDSRNTWTFRFLWTVCVGSVTAAPGWMGSIGTAWAAYDAQWQSSARYSVPVISTQFWMAYAATVTAVVVLGGWSYQRPAADIFVAGITQFPSTFYLMGLLWYGLPTLRLSLGWRWSGLIAFIANAPLLPLYPLLVYCTDLSLGQVNVVLHTNLFLAWTGQGRVLQQVATAWQEACIPPPRAVPVMKKKMTTRKQQKVQ